MKIEKMKKNFLEKLIAHTTVTDSIINKYSLLLDRVIRNLSDDIVSVKASLYRESNIDKYIKDFIDRQKLGTGLVLSFGTSKFSKTVFYGNAKEYSQSNDGSIVSDVVPIREDSVFDLASVSKVFTCYAVMKLFEQGLIDIDKPISNYDSRFVNIKNYSLRQILSFQKCFITDKLIDESMLLNEAEDLIFNIRAKDITLRPYSDMGAIIAKYVIESALHKDFFSIVKKTILIPNNLENTFINLEDCEKNNTSFLSNNFERKILCDECTVDCNTPEGVVHDLKAKVFGQYGKYFPGHAGLFSNSTDMVKFLQSILSQKIILKENIDKITQNYVGFKDEENNYSQHLGMLCHTKHPLVKQSEVYELLSDAAVAQGGYTGTYITYDIINDIFLFLGTNRCHNRITSISKEVNVTNKEQAENWKKQFYDTHMYAWQRDELIHKALDLAIQYSFLDYIFAN